MASEDTDFKQHSAINFVYRFLGGSALGIFMVLVPFLLSSVELNLLNIGVASFNTPDKIWAGFEPQTLIQP